MGLVVVAAALVAPTVASAEWWWFDHKQGRYPVNTFKKLGEPGLNGFTFTTTNNKTIGPCKKGLFWFTAELYNKFGGMGEGVIEKGTSTSKECETTIAECKLEKFEPSAGAKYGLTLKATEMVDISSFKFDVELVGNCENFAPKTFTAEGTVSGKWVDYDFEGGGGSEVDLKGGEVKPGGTKLLTYGTLNFGTTLVKAEEPEGFSPTVSPAVLKGTQLNSFFFTRSGKSVECKAATLSGTAEEGDYTVTVTPVYSNCNWNGFPATIKMNSCKLLLHLESELVDAVEEKYRYLAPTDLVCPENVAQLDIFGSEAAHTANNPTCRYTIGGEGNQGLKTLELTNKGDPSSAEKGWIEARAEIEGVSSKRTVGLPLTCGAENDAAGTITGMYKVIGETEAKAENGLGVFP
ncbi:MAG TPA: hypothetical protein VFM51_07820 [Solirubrobacterales bacterium]|nr:hypothetical protein [Solirubrobacterales bacterium]